MLRQDTPIVPAAMVCWRGGGGAPRSSDTPRPDLPQPNRLGPLQAATGGMPLMAQSWVMALQASWAVGHACAICSQATAGQCVCAPRLLADVQFDHITPQPSCTPFIAMEAGGAAGRLLCAQLRHHLDAGRPPCSRAATHSRGRHPLEPPTRV